MATGLSHQDLQTDAGALHAICEGLSEGVAVADSWGRLVFFNRKAEGILGLGPRGVGPEEWTAVYGCFLPDATTPYPPERMPLARALRGEEVMDEVMFVRNPARRQGVWISVSATPLHGDGGEIRGGVVVFRETPGPLEPRRGPPRPKRTWTPGGEVGEECAGCSDYFKRFKQAYDRISRAVEQTADTVVITDSAGKIEYVNPAFEKTTGYTRGEAIGNTPALLKSGEHDRAFYEHLWGEITAGHAYSGVIVNRKKDGELYWSQQSITPMTDEDGQITHYVSVLKDITNLRKLDEQAMHNRLAREVQQRLYPKGVTLAGFDIAGAAVSAIDLGGDYYDYVPLADGTLLVAIGDVTAHGLASALIMAQTRSYLRSLAKPGLDLAEVLAGINEAMVADLDGRRFVTLLLVHIDPESRTMAYASAGHLPGQVLSPAGDVVRVLPSTGLPLGLFPHLTFSRSAQLPLEPGQVVLLVTDGVTEASNGDDAEFGLDASLAFVRANIQLGAQELVDGLIGEAQRFSGGAPPEDDITCVVVRVLEESR